MVTKKMSVTLIRVRQTTHTTHDAKNIVVGSIDTDLSSLCTLNSSVGKNELKSSVVDTGEVAGTGRLVLLGAKCEGVNVDTGIGGTSVVLVRLDKVEVCTLTLGEAVLAVKLELSGDNGILTPAVLLKGALGKDESTGIGDSSVGGRVKVGVGVSRPASSSGSIHGTSIVEKITVEVGSRCRSNCGVCTESVDGVGKSIKSISVVERLGTHEVVEGCSALKGRTVVNVLIGLDNPDKLLNRVVEVKLDLVGGRTDRLVTCELELLNEVLVGVLGHSAALISVKEDVVNVKRSGDKRLVVSGSNLARTRCVC
jgi:hypothetical protein